jgi:predicted deacylase
MPGKRSLLLWIIIITALIVGAVILILIAPTDSIPSPTPSDQTQQPYEIIGTSVEGREIHAYTFGDGGTKLLFVGGIHGGYEWNSTALAYQAIEYFTQHQDAIPNSITIHIIPTLNPDGTYIATGQNTLDLNNLPDSNPSHARFNANQVDLNRNFDCKWQPQSTWRGAPVSAGTAPFSEPEAAALRDFVTTHNITATIFWHSQSNAVYASECEQGILPQTLDIMNVYANAAGYRAVSTFDAYEITGDAEGWLASINIPAITVELSTHETVEWEKNLEGIRALLRYYQ